MFWLGLATGIVIYIALIGVLSFVNYRKVKKQRAVVRNTINDLQNKDKTM